MIFHFLGLSGCLLSVVLRLPPTKRACGQVGNLKLVRPNVCRYKLLVFNYLQKFSRFPSAETKVQKNYQCSITSVSPHLPQTHVGCCHIFLVRIFDNHFKMLQINRPCSFKIYSEPNNLIASIVDYETPYLSISGFIWS